MKDVQKTMSEKSKKIATTKIVTSRHPKTTRHTKTQRHKEEFIHFFFVFLASLRPSWFVNPGALAVTKNLSYEDRR